MLKRNTIIFDLDGTLLNTLDDIADSINYALRKCGYKERTVEEIRRFVGGGAAVLVEKATPEGISQEELEHCKTVFINHYKKNSNHKTNLYEGIGSLVSQLAQEGYQMAIHSNKGDALVKRLSQIYFGDKIKVAFGEHPEIPRKPAPDALYRVMEMMGAEKTDCIYIGDSEVDVQTSHHAEIPCIAVTWGFRDKADLEEAHPYVIVDTVGELYQKIHELSKEE